VSSRSGRWTSSSAIEKPRSGWPSLQIFAAGGTVGNKDAHRIYDCQTRPDAARQVGDALAEIEVEVLPVSYCRRQARRVAAMGR
jgi:hypothetical protein